MYYNECVRYGSHLDSGEVCDCLREESQARRVTMADWSAVGEEFVNCLPPTTLRGDLVQAGEPYSHHYNPETDRCRCTYTTFANVDGEWVYCGKCFIGKTEEPPRLQTT